MEKNRLHISVKKCVFFAHGDVSKSKMFEDGKRMESSSLGATVWSSMKNSSSCILHFDNILYNNVLTMFYQKRFGTGNFCFRARLLERICHQFKTQTRFPFKYMYSKHRRKKSEIKIEMRTGMLSSGICRMVSPS